MAEKNNILYLKNGRIVTEEDDFLGGVVIENTKISRLINGNEEIPDVECIDLNGNIVLPGLVDDHVHFNEPGRTEWEGYRTGSMAAAAGGITTFLEMPLNSFPATTNRELLEKKREAVKSESVVDYGNWGGLVNNNLANLPELCEAGTIGLKAFMSNSGIDDFKRVDDDLLYAGLLSAKEYGNVVGVHAENEYVSAYLGQKFRDEGRTDRASWSESRPPEVELEAIRRACYWAGIAQSNLHIVHITIPEGIRAVAEAKDKGINVSSETCPHYLFFDEADFERIGPAAKCAPPIRSSEILDELWKCVLDGMVDTIASDHSPCLWDDKAPGMENIWNAWGGISGVQTMLPAILTEGVHKRGLPLSDLVRMMSSNPARIFGLYPQKGSLTPGADADITVIDLDEVWTLSTEDLYYKNKHSPYLGYKFKGKVLQTYVRGKIVFKDGKITAKPGFGEGLKRNYRYEY